jgi:hypothetical protein
MTPNQRSIEDRIPRNQKVLLYYDFVNAITSEEEILL